MIDKSSFRKHVSLLLIATTILSWKVCAQQKGTFIDSRDGHVYKWVKIGDQVWMAENLAYLPSVHSPYDESTNPFNSGSLEVDLEITNTPFQYVYGYDGFNTDMAKKNDFFRNYGVLYNYESATKSCPSGWHLPSDDEWKQLEKMVGMNSKEIDAFKFSRGNISEKLKSKLYWTEHNRGTDIYGFGLSPGGILFIGPDLDKKAKFHDIRNGGYFWTSTEYNHPILGKIGAFIRTVIGVNNIELKKGNKHIGRNAMEKYYGLSVRCIKD
jgi:uncharacterized protein (TIGR02145 family)